MGNLTATRRPIYNESLRQRGAPQLRIYGYEKAGQHRHRERSFVASTCPVIGRKRDILIGGQDQFTSLGTAQAVRVASVHPESGESLWAGLCSHAQADDFSGGAE
ncbi:hypothetical protein ABXR19_15455 [Uliginosibacterium flavum]|uniref:Uncharacterized protein n=1 Tax=Uliginosibacterium flavum TaxID=1396831 RepID=A0ABV2TPY4_9RHOO